MSRFEPSIKFPLRRPGYTIVSARVIRPLIARRRLEEMLAGGPCIVRAVKITNCPLFVGTFHRRTSLDEHLRGAPDDDTRADSNGPGRIESTTPGGNHRSGHSLVLVLFLFVARLGIVSSALLNLGQRCGPAVMADGRVALSRRDLDSTIHISSDLKFGPTPGGR